MACNQWSCPPAVSDWVTPLFYDSPSQPARVAAEMSMVVNSAVFVDSNRSCRASPPAPAIVNAASYLAPVAPDSIASAFGPGLAPGVSGVSVSVTDAAGVTRAAPVFYTSPSQLNFLIPAGTALGSATVRMTRTDGIVATAQVSVERLAPGLFTDADGFAAAVAVRVNPGGTQTVLPIGEPIDLTAGPVYLMLFGTGIRGFTASESVRALIDGLEAQVFFAGPQNQYAGLDQVNVLMPNLPIGIGEAVIELQVGGHAANQVRIRVQ
jgi:uncharacterized protein (TIGR03437 family)